MSAALIYRQPLLYEAAMIALYGRHYPSRYQAIASLIPDGASVTDVCCGPAVIYGRYLRKRRINYTGLDLSPRFISGLQKKGGRGLLWDASRSEPIPAADYVLMQASLYHFLPDPASVVDRLIQSARKEVIIAEPIRNLTSSKAPVIAWLSRRLTDAGNGGSSARFDRERLDRFFDRYRNLLLRSFMIPGEREAVYVLHGAALA